MPPLSPNPNLEQLKNQAKDLLKAHKAADPANIERLRKALSYLANLSDDEILQSKLSLKNAQQVIAREYGFARWADLKRHVESMPPSANFLDARVETIRRAVEAGDVETVKSLLNANPELATVHLERHAGEMALKTLLHRAEAKAVGKRMTPKHLQIAQLLIDHGADVNAIVDGFCPPLDVAAWTNNVPMVKLLLANGADPNLGTEATPVETAANHNGKPIFKLLVEAGAAYGLEQTIKLGMLKATRQLLDVDPTLVNQPTPNGYLPLHLAASRQGIFKLLLRRGADIHAKDGRGYTALIAAREAGNDQAVQELLQRGVPDDIFGAIAEGNEAKVAALLREDSAAAHPLGDGPAPIMWAIGFDSIPIVELLLEQQVNMNIRRESNYRGGTPLNQAIHKHHDELVRLLLKAGVDPDPDNGTGWWNPLVHALRFGTLQAAALLLDAGADPNRNTPPTAKWFGLGWPAHHGNLVQAKLLMDRGADMQRTASRKALAQAAEDGQHLFIELLGTHGVDVEAGCKWGNEKDKTPLERAVKAGHTEAAELIQEFIDLNRRAPAERAHILRSRARFIDAVIDGDAAILRKLLQENSALTDRRIVQVDLFNYSAELGHQAITDVLVEHGIPWTVVAAIALGRVEQVENLIAADPSLLKKAEPLQTAARANQVAVIELLLDLGANIDRLPENGSTALHHAVRCKAINAVEALLSRGAKVHLKDGFGKPPLWNNWPPNSLESHKVRDLLVAHGANPGDQRTTLMSL